MSLAARTLRHSLALVALGLGGVGAGCLIDLDRRIACGDGFVDRELGEECEPSRPSTFALGCQQTIRPEGDAACDPETCEIIRDLAQCSRCGDGIRDAPEECDGADLDGRRCSNGDDLVMCTDSCTYDFSACESCPDGVRDVDKGEECDPGGGFALQQQCEDLPTFMSPPFTSGQTSRCLDDCTWDRSTCGYCNNGRVDTRETRPELSTPELCDGDLFDDERLAQLLPNDVCDADPNLRVNVECNEFCNDYIERPGPDLCCIIPGKPCPPPTPPGGGESLKCCHEFAHPDETEHCEEIIDGEGARRQVCK